MKKTLVITSFYTSAPKIIICHTVPEICCVTDVIFIVILAYFLPFYPPAHPPSDPKKQNFKKIKKLLEISSFYPCVPKIMIIWYMVPEKWCVTDKQTDGQKKWHIEVGAPPKKFRLILFLDNFVLTENLCPCVFDLLSSKSELVQLASYMLWSLLSHSFNHWTTKSCYINVGRSNFCNLSW